MIKIYKYLNGLSPQIMNDIFKLRKKLTIWEMLIYLNTKILEQSDTVYVVLPIELVRFHRYLPLKQETQFH